MHLVPTRDVRALRGLGLVHRLLCWHLQSLHGENDRLCAAVRGWVLFGCWRPSLHGLLVGTVQLKHWHIGLHELRFWEICALGWGYILLAVPCRHMGSQHGAEQLHKLSVGEVLIGHGADSELLRHVRCWGLFSERRRFVQQLQRREVHVKHRPVVVQRLSKWKVLGHLWCQLL